MNIQDIEAARERIKPFIFESPLVYTETLSTLTGNSVHLKLENLQMTGSFKERGALNRLLTLSDEERSEVSLQLRREIMRRRSHSTRAAGACDARSGCRSTHR